LIKHLDARLSGKLNVASAPAGFVMTPLMSEWVRNCGGRKMYSVYSLPGLGFIVLV
jgi:ATP/maltotriose-dependent transcriptional regulator MalT